MPRRGSSTTRPASRNEMSVLAGVTRPGDSQHDGVPTTPRPSNRPTTNAGPLDRGRGRAQRWNGRLSRHVTTIGPPSRRSRPGRAPDATGHPAEPGPDAFVRSEQFAGGGRRRLQGFAVVQDAPRPGLYTASNTTRGTPSPAPGSRCNAQQLAEPPLLRLAGAVPRRGLAGFPARNVGDGRVDEAESDVRWSVPGQGPCADGRGL